MVPSLLGAQLGAHSLHNALTPKHPDKKIVYLDAEAEHRETITMKSGFLKVYKWALGVKRSSFEGRDLTTPALFFLIVRSCFYHRLVRLDLNFKISS